MLEAIIVLISYLTIFAFGAVIGSFCNVCIYRLPEKESLVPSSHCMSCGHWLGWRDMFPVFSYLLLKGRCRYCGGKVSPQYPIIEAVNGIAYVIVFMACGFGIRTVLYCLMASALLVISVIDERTMEIPVILNYFLTGLGILGAIADWTHVTGYLIGFISISLPLFLLYMATGGNAIGGGDIKMMASCGLLLGWKKIVLAFFLGCIIGAVCHSIRMKVQGVESKLAMGPYLATAVFLCGLWGDNMIAWYVSLLV